jgi:hypothetical protein
MIYKNLSKFKRDENTALSSFASPRLCGFALNLLSQLSQITDFREKFKHSFASLRLCAFALNLLSQLRQVTCFGEKFQRKDAKPQRRNQNIGIDFCVFAPLRCIFSLSVTSTL